MKITKITKIITSIALITCFSFVFTGCTVFTVVKHDKSNGDSKGAKFYFDDNSFDSDKYVASIWESKVIPAMEKKPADITQVIKELKGDVDSAGKKYGIRSSEVGSAWNFIVKGKGKVVKVNKESRNGTLDIDLEPFDNNKDMILQVGPVFKGTSVRDSLDFIKFDDFKNQLVFASVSSSLNKYIRDNVTNKLDLNNINGQEINYVGAFTFESLDNIIVTPVKIEKAGGSK